MACFTGGIYKNEDIGIDMSRYRYLKTNASEVEIITELIEHQTKG